MGSIALHSLCDPQLSIKANTLSLLRFAIVRMAVSVFVLLLSTIVLAQGQQDVTREPVEPLRNYCDVVEVAVQQVEQSGVFETTWGFLRLLAFVDTRDGVTLDAKGKGGLWKISKMQYDEIQNSKYIQSTYAKPLAASDLKLSFQRSQTPYEDLDKPLVSAVFAILSLANKLHEAGKDFTDIPRDQRMQFATYNLYCDSSQHSCNKFTAAYETFQTYSCQQDCNPKLDIIFVVDGSGSVGSTNFQITLDAIATLSAQYQIGPQAVQVGVIVYSGSPSPRIELNQYSTASALMSAIQSISYPSGSTSTGAAITYAHTNGFASSFGARPQGTGVARVLIVATDGQSGDDVKLPSDAARMDGINIFSLGIGQGANPVELLDIADSPNQVYYVDQFSGLSQITFLIRTASCKARAIVGIAEPVVTSVIPDELKFLSVSIQGPLSISFSGMGSNLIIYGSFRFRNPGPELYDFIWNVAEETFTITTRSTDTKRKRRQSSDSGQMLYLAVASMSSNATLTVDVEPVTLPNISDLAVRIQKIPSPSGTLSYLCTANCTCEDASVVWEKEGFDSSLPNSVNVTTSDGGRQAQLQIDQSSPDHFGSYSCVIRSPRVIGSDRSSVQVLPNCTNGGELLETGICLCTLDWEGRFCDQCK